MTDQATRVVPAGWYDDPASPARVRWWNGIAWTEHVADRPSEADQAAAAERAEREAAEAANAARIAEVRRLELEFGISTSETAVVGPGYDAGGEAGTGFAEYAEQDAHAGAGGEAGHAGGELRRDRRNRIRRPLSAATGSSWLIALSPLLTLVLAAAAGYAYLFITPSPLLFAVLALPYLLTLVWAARDAAVLRDREFDPPRWPWALLGGAGYLIVRRIRVPGSGALVTFVVLTLAALGAVAAVWFSGALSPAATGLAIQNDLAAELRADGATALDCPLWLESTGPESTYACDATVGGEQRQVWVVLDGDGGYDWAYAVE